MTRKDAIIEEVKQRLDEDLLTDLRQFPSSVRRWFVNNVFQRTLAYLIGFTEDMKTVRLKATKAGVLKVAMGGSGFEFVTVRSGIAGTTESPPIVFPAPISRVRFVITDFDMFFRPSRDGAVFQDQIYIFAGRDFQLDLVVKSFKVQRARINDASYRIEGYQ